MFRDSFWGLNGFDELRKHVKQGNEFCKEVGAILQERSDLHNSYAKSLSKLGSKLNKSSSSCIGTLAEAWGLVAAEMEAEAEYHRQLSSSLSEEIYKPMKLLAETQNKSRKPIESVVDKAMKTLHDKRADEMKYKKLAFMSSKDRESLCTQISNARNGRGKNTTDKDINKLEKQLVKLEDSIKKAEKNYSETSQKAETCREEWESAVYKACSKMQALEEERISQMQDFMNKYNSQLSVIGPKVTRSCDKLGEAVLSIDTNSDIRRIVDQKGTGPNQPEQLLPDFFAEDVRNNIMDPEKRRQVLQNYLLSLEQEIEKEQKAKEGVEKLVEVYQNRPSFADADAQDETRSRLRHVRSMLDYLEASHHKVSCAMAELENRPRPTSKYDKFMERTKDKQGMNVSILRLPKSVTNDVYGGAAGSSLYRQSGDGGQVDSPMGPPPPYRVELTHNTANKDKEKMAGACGGAPHVPVKSSLGRVQANVTESKPRKSMVKSDSSRQSYFSEDDDFDNDYDQYPQQTLGQARAIYDYNAQQYDELSIRPGDIITVYDKQEDGWWQGELHGKVGIFPATYVEEAGQGESHS